MENQPYDESLDVNETEEVASIYAPSPPQPGGCPGEAGTREPRDTAPSPRDTAVPARRPAPRAPAVQG